MPQANAPVPSRGEGLLVPEEPLRQTVLRTYHDYWGHAGKPRLVLAAVRQLLSGAPCGDSVLERYWLEEDPEASALSFAQDLEKATPGLARAALEPLCAAASQAAAKRSRELAPNVPVYLASLAGPIALRCGLDEALVASVLCAATLGLCRVGAGPFNRALASLTPTPS
jgi:hypothetical protein